MLPKEFYDGVKLNEQVPSKPLKEMSADVEAELSAIPHVTGIQLGAKKQETGGYRMFMRCNELPYDILLDGWWATADEVVIALHVQTENMKKGR